jgi:hypothetical protein
MYAKISLLALLRKTYKARSSLIALPLFILLFLLSYN